MAMLSEQPIKTIGYSHGTEWHYASGKIIYAPHGEAAVVKYDPDLGESYFIEQSEQAKQVIPSVLERITNLKDTFVTIAKEGAALASDEEYRARLDVCMKCGHFTDRHICAHLVTDGRIIEKGCGCYMPVKAKLKAMSCPAGHW